MSTPEDKKQKMPAWLQKKKETLEKRRKENMKEKGLAEFWTLEEGETKVKLINPDAEPREEENTDFGGMKTIWRVKILNNPEAKEPEYDLSTSDTLTKKIMKAVYDLGINPFTIIRVGEDKQTRYSIKELKKKKN